MRLPLALSACLAAALCAASAHAQTAAAAPAIGDIPMGQADAGVTIIEYASITCGACEHFNAETLPKLKARYVISGEARFVLRGLTTPPAPISLAGLALARCAGAEQYYSVIGDLFRRQSEILKAARSGGVQAYFLEIGAAHGLEPKQVEDCIRNKQLQAFLEKEADDGPDATNLPVILVNDHRIEGSSFEAVAKAVDAELAANAAAKAAAAAAAAAAPAIADTSGDAPSAGSPALTPVQFGPGR